MKLLFNITHGFQARMLLRTKIAEGLEAAGATMVVVSPNADEPYFRAEFDRPGYVLERMPEHYPKAEKAMVSTRAYFLMNPSLGATLHYKRDQYKMHHPWRYQITRAGNVVLGSVPLLRRAYLNIENTLFSGRELDTLLATHQPDLVVSGTPGYNAQDAHILRAARRHGIPTATVMLSWDNLTSKGYMAAEPDHLLVWNAIMADEARRYHDYQKPIYEVGAAQFDIYGQDLAETDGHAFRERHGIAADKKLIVWGTINEAIYPGQLDVLRAFCEELSRPEHQDKVLWVRIHPQTIFGSYAHLADEHRALASDRVIIELPPVRSEKLKWDLPRQDMWHLTGLLKAADLLITPQSTLTIDAACAGTPIINLAIDKWFARVFKYTHYRDVVDSGGVWIVHSMDELMRATGQYLAKPELHRDGRERIVSHQMGQFFGRAGERTAAVLMDLARGATTS